MKYREFEDLLHTTDWGKAESVTIFDPELTTQTQYLRHLIETLNFAETKVIIDKEKKIERLKIYPLLLIKLYDKTELGFYYVSGFRLIRFLKVFLLYLFMRIISHPVRKTEMFLTCEGGSIFSIHRRMNKNLPELISEPAWTRVKRSVRLTQNTLKRLFSLNGIIVVKRDV